MYIVSLGQSLGNCKVSSKRHAARVSSQFWHKNVSCRSMCTSVVQISTARHSRSLTGVAVNRDLGLSLPEMTAMAAARAWMAPRLAATSSAIFTNFSAAALGTASRDLTAAKHNWCADKTKRLKLVYVALNRVTTLQTLWNSLTFPWQCAVLMPMLSATHSMPVVLVVM